MTHPDIKWTLDPAILISIALWCGVYVWRFRNARRQAGGRGAGWLLLGDIAPTLLLLSLSRVIMRPATRRFNAIERKLGRLASPATFILTWFALLYFWHIPALYVAAIEHPAVHALEHISFFTAGVAVWWPLIQPVPMRHRLTGLGTSRTSEPRNWAWPRSVSASPGRTAWRTTSTRRCRGSGASPRSRTRTWAARS